MDKLVKRYPSADLNLVFQSFLGGSLLRTSIGNQNEKFN